jgi:phosphohistidine phosphatase SixA
VLSTAVVAHAHGPDTAASRLISALKKGGCVVVMRHASSPAQPPIRAEADADNVNLERQLDKRGRSGAAAMGTALRRLRILVTDVWTSPTFRARQTARLAKLHRVKTDERLGDGGQSMQGATEVQFARLRALAAERPGRGNALIITQQPNIAGAFPGLSDVSDGESLVFRPDGRGGTQLLGRIKIDDWSHLVP